jgi:hypothetical protein
MLFPCGRTPDDAKIWWWLVALEGRTGSRVYERGIGFGVDSGCSRVVGVECV